MCAVDQDPKRLWIGPGHAGQHLDNDRGLVDPLRGYVVEVFGGDDSALGEPRVQPFGVEQIRCPQTSGDQSPSSIDIPVELASPLRQAKRIDLAWRQAQRRQMTS